jgi:zinc transport system ATP-binding protein
MAEERPRGRDPLIEAAGVIVRMGKNELLSGVDLAIYPSEIVSLIGPNGAGKTTLIRSFLGIQPIAAGKIARRLGLVIGYVPQRLQLDPILPISVNRFLSLGRVHRGEDPAVALDEVGVRRLRGASLHDLSGGEFQRVLLARALARRPDLLILDEPAQGIDFSGQIELYRLIETIRDQRGCGVLMVSHDLHIVMSGTNRVICLNRHVCCAGQPEAVSRHPDYQRLFGPRASQNLAVYTHHHDHRHDLAGEVVDRQGQGAPADAG